MAKAEGPRGAGLKIQVPIVWVGTDDVQVVLVNNFFAQFVQPDQDEFILTLGTVVPPALLGTPEQMAEQARAVSFVPVRAVARLGLTRQRVVELGRLLETILRQYDEARKAQ